MSILTYDNLKAKYEDLLKRNKKSNDNRIKELKEYIERTDDIVYLCSLKDTVKRNSDYTISFANLQLMCLIYTLIAFIIAVCPKFLEVLGVYEAFEKSNNMVYYIFILILIFAIPYAILVVLSFFLNSKGINNKLLNDLDFLILEARMNKCNNNVQLLQPQKKSS